MEERLRRQLNFALEIDKEKNILRQTHLSGQGRRENDAEHAWHMALMAYLLREYSNEPVEIGKVMLLCLIHDIVEIEAGDTYAYDTEGLETQKAREDAAKEKIYSLLPEDQKREFIALFDEFEANETPEARFAHAMDNLQPLLLNHSNQGGDWRAHQVTARQVYGRQENTRRGSKKLYAVTDQILRAHISRGNLRGEPPAIRPQRPADLEQTAALWKAVNQEVHAFIPARYWEDQAAPVREALARGEVYVYERQGEILGFAGLSGTYLQGLFVREDSRSQGVGKALLDYVKWQTPRLTLRVCQKNPRALKFYRREGFTLRQEGVEANTGEREYEMAWEAGGHTFP